MRLLFRLACSLFVPVLLAAGCYTPSIPDGVQLCSVDGKCADGMTCFADNHCYKTGANPTCATPCTGATPACDLTTLKCVGCLHDSDCPTTSLCDLNAKTCKLGCNAGHPACSADAGSCDVDAGLCRGCNSDQECAAGNAATPRCDLATTHCQPCLPDNDNCAAGSYCDGTPGNYTCKPGCKGKADCTDGTTPDCCAHVCVDTSADAMNCGACAKSCGMGGACCNGACFDITGDLQNCGGCGMSCQPANVATASCSMSMCGYDACTMGNGDCDMNKSNGCEQDLTSDVNNCGMCANACTVVPNAVDGCLAGACIVASCAMNFGDCNGVFDDGCESNLDTDISNCGTCSHSCPTPIHATPGCAAGMCGVGTCTVGFGDCDNMAGNGCEAGLNTDVKNCGACGTTCALANTIPNCAAGKCTAATCMANFADCDKLAANGCEVNTQTDAKNCSACGTACALANTTPTCTLGKCTAANCTMNFADCDKLAPNGCEVNTQTDIKNCGTCSTVCALANATQACTLGKCAIGSCNANFADCDKMVANGCEVNTQTDANNCGACATVCGLANATQSCALGKCAVGSCNANFADCDKVATNGCEVNTQTDNNNCGGCAVVCAAGKTCKSGVCTTCNATVLLLGDGTAEDTAFMTALTNAGMTPTNGGIFTSYAGVPAASNFGAVVISIGDQYSTDMPAAGQTAILNAANATTGVVFTEWAAYEVSNSRFATLAGLMLLQRTSGNTSTLTFTNTVAHPVWTGLPASFVTKNAMGSNVGSTLLNGGVQIATCTECMSSGVVVRDNGKGRIVQIAHAGTFQAVPIFTTDTNAVLLWTNSAKWAGKCL